MQAVPINDAESVIEAFWDVTLSDIKAYKFRLGPGTGAKVEQGWCWVEFAWDDATAGQTIFTMTREVDIPTETYDALRIRCGVPSSAKLTFTAVVNGREQTVVDGEIGPDRKWEFTGSITGNRLERLTVTVEAVKPGPGGMTLQWIALVNREIERVRLSRRSPYTPDWPKFLRPASEPASFEPTLGILFDAKDLDHIRKKARHPAFASVMERLRQKARENLAAEPERFVMESGATINRHHRAHEIARGESDPSNTALVCGLVGLIDRDATMLRMAGRAMLAMAHAEYWDECFAEHFPGSAFDHRGFTASDNSYACGLGLDWAGSVLTEAGQRIICEALSKKGLTLINKDFLQYDYIYDCNQGPSFSPGRVAALLAVLPRWPHARKWLDLAEADLRECIERAFNLTADHGGLEGAGYSSATVDKSLWTLRMLSRYRGKPFAEMVPECLRQSADFFLMFLSTARPAGHILPYGDCAADAAYALDMASQMAEATGDERFEQLRRAMLAQDSTAHHLPVNGFVPGLYTLVFSESPQDAGEIVPPRFRLLSSTGMLVSCRRTEHGLVRLQLIGAARGAGHVHQDKGSFILEAFGEALAIDRGILNYGHPLCKTLTRATMHNVLCPAPISDREEEQLVGGHEAILPTGRGDDQTMEARIDTTAVWAGRPFQRHVRRIVSPEPTLFFIEDEVEFDQPRGATFRLHTYFPIDRDGERFVLHGGRAGLAVTPSWALAEARYGEYFVDGLERPVQGLALTSEPGTAYRLITVLEVLPAGQSPRWMVTTGADGTVVARSGSREHTYRAT